MSLLAPWALWFTPVAAVVIGLYLLKVRRTRQVVPSIEFWMRLAEEPPVRSLLRRLKRLLSLLLWLIIVASVLFAVGNPVLVMGKAKPRAIVVIIDNSASMLTHESESGNATRIQLAKSAVADLTSRRPVHDEWLLIEAAEQPRVAQSWTRDRRTIREAANTIVAHSGSNNLAESLVLARQLLTGKQRPTIVLVSDGGNGAWNVPTPGVEVIHWDIGQTDDNLGVTRIYVRQNRQEGSQQIYVAVANASQVEVKADLIFELDDSPIGVEPIVIEPGGTWEKTTSFRYPDGGVIRAYIDRADALPEDDGAFAILQPLRAARVLLVSADVESYFITQALYAMPTLVDMDVSRSVTPDGYADSLTEEYDLVIMNNWAPKRLPERGRFILINEITEDVSIRVVGELSQPVLGVDDRNHPLMRFVEFEGATVTRVKELDVLGRADILASTGEGDPVIVHLRQPGRDVLYLAFDVLETDIPFRNSFPILLRNALTYLAEEQTAWVEPQAQVGSIIHSLRPLPDSITHVSVIRADALKDEPPNEIPVRGGTFTITDTSRVGPLRIDIGSESAYVAINVADDGETRIAPYSDNSSEHSLVLNSSVLAIPPWMALAGAAMALVCLEWFTYSMRWTE